MIKGMAHVGVSVANLDQSIDFYRKGLGMAVVEQGPFEGEQYDSILGLKGAKGRVALLKAANLQIELFEFTHPSPRPSGPDRPVCDHGITHFCIEVADIEGAYERLKAAGAWFHCPPRKFIGTGTATYGRDPDGNVFELLELSEVSKSE
jgi:catechol 2,3-dioxygenase-like lactoylglutathione lyase family enzyme